MKRVASFLFLFILFACVSPKISVKKISEIIEIKAGDSAWVFWEFSNARYVKVSGFDKIFEPIDSLLIRPQRPMRLDIVAYGYGKEQVIQSVYILVSELEKTKIEEKQTIQRGPKFVENVFEQKNQTISNYFLGFISGSFNNLTKLKIFRVKQNSLGDSITVSFGLLDNFGNFGYDVAKYSSDVKIEVGQKCQGNYIGKRVYPFPQTIRQNIKLNLFLLIDYSIIGETSNLKQYILNAVKFLDLDDRVSLSFFGSELNSAIDLERADKFYWDLEDYNFPERYELSSVFRSLWELMDEINENSNSVIVLITNKMDNSSINYTLEDVLEKANKKQIAINTLTYGTEVSPSAYRYIASKTGGNAYHFPWRPEDLNFGLTEIILSNKYYYTLSVPLDKKAFDCRDLYINLSVNSGQISFSDTFVYPLKDRLFYTNYQAVSLFSFADTTINNSFLPIINNLADLLVNYRNLTVELIGTAGISESLSDPMKLSLERAFAVRNRLLAKGVFPSQIQTKGIGISKPLFPVEEEEKVALFNRRVEIRWLLPDVLPYTIVVDTTVSEETAEKKVEFWEKQGFKSFYDRILTKKGIMYKVVLWGYPKYEDAEKDAKRISKKYKKPTYIE